MYIRFIVDRSIEEKDFGKIQKDRVAEMKWARKLKRIAETEKDKINLAIVAANNHYAGFGPGESTVLSYASIFETLDTIWNSKRKFQ